jgi:hypothetical protein
MSQSIVYNTEELLPDAWRRFAAPGPVRAFNPGLLCDGDGWIFAYRIVGPDGLRRIGLCRLDGALRVNFGSQQPFSDHVRFAPGHGLPEIATQWFADPRLYRLGGQLYIYWNSGWHEPGNHQFVQALDPATLRPVGHPRELLLRGGRQKLEKNWTFFEHPSGTLHALYSILPHCVLQFTLAGDGPVVFEEVVTTNWALEAYPPCHGGLRGGAPPQFAEGDYSVFCHSVHDGAGGYRYAAAVYRFAATYPFQPVHQPSKPLALAAGLTGRRVHPRLNPAVAEVIYPCGAARDGDRWVVSHGLDDERCAISILSEDEVLANLAPVAVR